MGAAGKAANCHLLNFSGFCPKRSTLSDFWPNHSLQTWLIVSRCKVQWLVGSHLWLGIGLPAPKGLFSGTGTSTHCVCALIMHETQTLTACMWKYTFSFFFFSFKRWLHSDGKSLSLSLSQQAFPAAVWLSVHRWNIVCALFPKQ